MIRVKNGPSKNDRPEGSGKEEFSVKIRAAEIKTTCRAA
jgi:hypothetical protein